MVVTTLLVVVVELSAEAEVRAIGGAFERPISEEELDSIIEAELIYYPTSNIREDISAFIDALRESQPHSLTQIDIPFLFI